jgi:hypothetical protein
MDSADDAARVREVRRLLERIQALPGNPEGPAATQGVVNPYYQWANYHATQLATLDAVRRAPVANAGSVNPWFFVVATSLNTIVAAVLAVLITLSVVRQEPRHSGSGARDFKTAVLPPAAKDFPRASTPMRPLGVQPIGSPEHPLRLEVLSPSRLPLRIQPEEAGAETYILVLSGVPAKADVQGANRIGADSWLLPPNSIQNLRITMPEWSTSVMEIGVELRHTDGAIAARTKAWIAVPPPPMPQGAGKVDQAALREMLQRGDRLLSRGDIVAARTVYERAAEMGSAQAALALGATYDQSRLWSFGVFGMVGNKERARQWYARAEQLGHADAKDRLRALGD